jgi:hypothetical protein
MTTNQKSLGQTKLHSLLTPERKFLETRKPGNTVSFRSPYANMK